MARGSFGQTSTDQALRLRLSYLDRRSVVVLGDPAAALPTTATTDGQDQ
jgi:hypothetical protein